MGEGYAYRCETCGGEADWVITRHGDVVTSWACSVHLHGVLVGLKRRREVTTYTVRASVAGNRDSMVTQIERVYIAEGLWFAEEALKAEQRVAALERVAEKMNEANEQLLLKGPGLLGISWVRQAQRFAIALAQADAVKEEQA